MTNAFENISWIGAEALTHLEDALMVMKMCAKDVSGDFNTKPNGYAIGDTVSFKTRPEYEVKEFTSTITAQPVRQSKRSLTIEKHFDVSVEITAKEMAMNMDSFSEDVIKPAMYEIANKVDAYCASKIVQGAGLYVSDTLLETSADMALARKAANLQQLGMNRFALVDSTLEAMMLGKDYFGNASVRGQAGAITLATGIMGQLMGINWYSSLNFPTPSTAFIPGDATATTNNTGSTNLIGQSTLTVDAMADTKVIKAGDRLMVAGVKRPLVVKTGIADCDGVTAIELVDPITEIIPDGAAVTIIGTGHNYTINGAIFDGQSLAVAMPILDAPADKPSISLSNNGVSVRVVQGYDMSTKKTTMSLDCLVGGFALDIRRITLLASY